MRFDKSVHIFEVTVLVKSVKSHYSAIILTAVAFTASGCAINTATYGTGESVEAGLARDLASLATFGTLGKKKGQRISYRERGPLVLPTDQQFAAIPRPIDSVDNVDESFPGRAAEVERAKAKEEKEEARAIVNPALGVSRAQALGNLSKNDKERAGGDLDQQINAAVGSARTTDARELIKTPEDYARERGVTVEELPEALRGGTIRERSILERAGLVAPKRSQRGQSLTDVPVEYRTVQQNPNDPNVDKLLETKKKKKKRFLFF